MCYENQDYKASNKANEQGATLTKHIIRAIKEYNFTTANQINGFLESLLETFEEGES